MMDDLPKNALLIRPQDPPPSVVVDIREHGRGVVISREELLRDVWGERYGGGARTVDIHIRRLRAKLGAQWFETTRGIGYKFRRRT
jgi:Transcriptional regulatory protein, C terminal